VDLVAVIETLAANHIHLPLVLRFPDILQHRMLELQTCFSLAAAKFNYKVLLTLQTPLVASPDVLCIMIGESICCSCLYLVCSS
jgi:arginine decarboxylase